MNFIKKISFLVLVIILISYKEKSKESKVVSSDITLSKPNVILIVIENKRYGEDLRVLDDSIIKIPNIDKFLRESLELINLHVNTKCTSTIVGIVTGKNVNQNNEWHTIVGGHMLQEDEKKNLHIILQSRNYKTT